MPKYKAQTVQEVSTTATYEYCHKVEVFNPLNGTPTIAFRTSTVEDDGKGNETLTEYGRTLWQTKGPNETFNLIHPVTGDVVGTLDTDTVQLALYSLFFHIAEKQDGGKP